MVKSLSSKRGKNPKTDAVLYPKRLVVLTSDRCQVQEKIGRYWLLVHQGMTTTGTKLIYCHAYHILKKHGFKDDRIVVFMFDDVASDPRNPQRGTLINSNDKIDYYHGVVKDYTGKYATLSNFEAVLLGEKSRVRGGSGKVLNTGPRDKIFFYYADHGSDSSLGLPSGGPIGKEGLGKFLNLKFLKKRYESMVLYLTACQGGNIGMYIPKRSRIYAVSCGSLGEDCEATYCHKIFRKPPPYAPDEYVVCLATSFGFAWMNHSENVNPKKVTLQDQYEEVKRRVWSSTVMQHGDIEIAKRKLSDYIGSPKPWWTL